MLKTLFFSAIQICGSGLIRLYWHAIYASYRRRANFAVHPMFKFNGHGIQLYGNGRISLGENSYIGELSTLQAYDGSHISIGKYCQISHNVRFYTQSALPDSDFSVRPVPGKQGDILVGDYCWIGANAFINPGITIGDNSVIGANSVVTKNIPANEIWGGVPAKFIRKKRGS